jgi:hypothetical protein
MPLLELNEITPGMTPEQPVKNLQGQILVQKGVPLTEKHLKIFKTWGVDSIEIQGSTENLEHEQIDFEVVKEQIEKKFILNTSNHPFIENLKTVLVRKTVNESLGGL